MHQIILNQSHAKKWWKMMSELFPHNVYEKLRMNSYPPCQIHANSYPQLSSGTRYHFVLPFCRTYLVGTTIYFKLDLGRIARLSICGRSPTFSKLTPIPQILNRSETITYVWNQKFPYSCKDITSTVRLKWIATFIPNTLILLVR